MSNAFQIRGGKPLSGEITPQGAKNEALQILCAVLLTGDEVRIKNIPDIKDVNQLIDILRDLGVIITKMVRVITPSKQITLTSIISSLRNSK